jgi:hypothetical protein
MVPKETIEGLLDALRKHMEYHKLSGKSSKGPNLTGGAVALLRRSVSNTPEPSMGPSWSPPEDQINSSSSNKSLGNKSTTKDTGNFGSNSDNIKSSNSSKNSNNTKSNSGRSGTGSSGSSSDNSVQKKTTNTHGNNEDSSSNYGTGVHVPKIIGGTSGIVNADDRINVAGCLPYECRDYNWQLEYSSNQHGLSWHTLHRCIANTGPNIVIIRTTEGEVLGGYATQSWVTNGE